MSYSIPWVEKYKPNTLSEVVGNESVVDKLKGFALKGSFPHMTLIGPAGTGKTASAICLVKDTFKGKATVRVMNASHERGIKTIQNDVTEFASHKALGGKFKVLIMDEADHLTEPAQAALREVIGQHTRNCRFILICNFGERIIEPILSRCPPLYFSRLIDIDVLSVLQRIALAEKKSVDPAAYAEIVTECNGDLRTAINRLETACTGVDRVSDTSFMGMPKIADVENVLVSAMNNPFDIALEVYKQAALYVAPDRFLQRAIDCVYESQNPNLSRRLLAEQLALTDFTRGNEEVQVLGLIARLSKNYATPDVPRAAKRVPRMS